MKRLSAVHLYEHVIDAHTICLLILESSFEKLIDILNYGNLSAESNQFLHYNVQIYDNL